MANPVRDICSPEQCLEVLRDQPGYETLLSALRYLSRKPGDPAAFNISRPTPQSAQMVQVLVSDIAPNYWALLQEDSAQDRGSRRESADKELFLGCLRSLAGINAILVRLRALIQKVKTDTIGGSIQGSLLSLQQTVDLLNAVLDGDGRVQQIWTSTTGEIDGAAKKKPLEQEFLAVLGGGRVVSLSAEVEQVIKQAKGFKQATQLWTPGSSDYSMWLARNIATWITQEDTSEDAKICSNLFDKALRLGHSGSLVHHLVQRLVLSHESHTEAFRTLCRELPPLAQRKVLYTVLKTLSEQHLSCLGKCESDDSKPMICAVAGAICSMVGTDGPGRSHLIDWSTSSTGAGLGEGVGIRRAVVAAIAQDKDSIVAVFEQSLRQFGDPLYVKHAPTLQQEAHAQILIISAGYIHRKSPIKLALQLRSSEWLNAISNRIGASQDRARFLGMVAGEALSGLVDTGEKKLDFHMEETGSEEGRWYQSLAHIADDVGPLAPLLDQPDSRSPKITRPGRQKETPQQSRTVKPPSRGFVIEEVEEGEEEADDLVPYDKPDSDAEDSDEDPTLIRRDKPKAAVYIRDLIRQLRDTENYDHQNLAISTAPLLIRRKANHGTEVSEHSEELASLLVGLHDKFDLEKFEEFRIQGMVAVLTAQPKAMGPWFAKTFFDGDYSLHQRASILVVLGLSARELAGFETSEYAEAASFASKRLPERVEKLFVDASSPAGLLPPPSILKALPRNALDSIARDLTNNILAPMAASAADAASGPDVLKLSTFTSRLQHQQQEQQSSGPSVTRKARARPRVRVITNTAAQLIASGFFFPLTARFQAAVHSPAARTRGIVFQPMLLALFIKTLALLLHAAGPSTLALPQMTAELWSLLLASGVRARCVGDLGVTGAVLFALLTLLEVNEDRMRDICQEMGRELVETQEWVAGMFEGIRGDDGGQEDQVKMMAAAVLMQIKEGVEKYRLLLVGDLIG